VRSDRKDDIDHYRHLSACFTCPLKPRCTPDKLKRLKRWAHEAVLDKMQARHDHMPDAMGIRRQTVEHPFATRQAWMGASHFLTRTLKKVRTEMSLHVLAYNMKRMIKIFGVGPLMGAIRACSRSTRRSTRSQKTSQNRPPNNTVRPACSVLRVFPRPRSSAKQVRQRA
jgi:hypothetical protein